MTGPAVPGQPVSADRALAAAAELGSFFGLQDRPEQDWTTTRELVESPAVLSRRCAEVAGLLGPAASPRVVASLVHLGVVARLLSPPVGAVLAAGALPVAGAVHLRLTGSNPVPMAWDDVSTVPAASPEVAAEQLAEHWLTPLVAPWTALVSATGLSQQVLHGNVVSAVNGAATIASGVRPELAGPGAALVDALTRTGPLAGTGQRRGDGSFVRASCCLFYRVPGAGTCADCVFERGVPA